MAIQVREGRTVLKTFDTFAAAKAYVETLGVSFMEDDADNDDCADALLINGRIIAIQPDQRIVL